ncbi:hypothetical protein HYH02_013585 [Chlamydomonas schloesseri]|uniref:Uncharacterized protein n=1 Tax=Chlamydomonas schloesseri TaxID=2026947 RepID=A0A835T371_9CHLO|nr:hypothetical protein HYH02_013585 [Chlamydomonas schloesseri]|eukprot:KAG2430746.1 hypothetical protein HYH02_013585 [Chlamydomonas schloesseri]
MAELKKGARVRLHSLSTSVLNDAVGCIVGPLDGTTGRHPVKLLSPPEAVAAFPSGVKVKPSNLEKVEAPQPQPPPKNRKTGITSHAVTPEEVGRLSDTVGAKGGWRQSIPSADQAEWFVDAYRLRIDDDYAWGGCNLHGLYDPESTAGSITADFLVYCKLAMASGVAPAAPGWDWKACLSKAAALLRYAYEKSDAQERWGPMAGMMLRMLAEQVYGTSCMMGEESPALTAMRQTLGLQEYTPEEAEERLRGLMQTRRELFNDVGGADAWLQLVEGVQKEMNRT